MPAHARGDIRRLFELLNEELRHSKTRGELYLVGGAVMCLAYNARESTADVDAVFRPTAQVREAANRVAAKSGFPADWLNAGVKGYLDVVPFLDLDHLKVMVAQPKYLLAMKCLAIRIGAEFHDLDDVRFLLRLLDIHSYDQIVTVITKYYPLERFPPKSLYALEELLPKTSDNAAG
jgi:Nucleotidyltransferase of unknown function (DUF6036)